QKLLVALEHGREMIPRELADFAREHRGAVRKENLHLREAAGVDKDLAWRRMARVIFEVDAEPAFPHRYPCGFAAPPAVDELAPQGQQLADRGAGPRRVCLLQPRLEGEGSGCDAEQCHR